MFTKIIIPVAAFAVTATTVGAFNGNMLQNLDVDLTDEQVSALEEVGALHGQHRAEIHNILDEAGFDREAMRALHKAGYEYRTAHHEAVQEAIEAEDFEAYQEAVVNSPRADLIDTEAKFEQLLKAYELREEGEYEAARDIMEELGFTKQNLGNGGPRMGAGDRGIGNEEGNGQRRNGNNS
jgi:hypothetical protein